MKQQDPTARRRFIKIAVAGVAAAPALFSGTAGAQAPVSETNPQAQALNYKVDATKAAQRKDPNAFCHNCLLYTGKPGAADGPCSIFAGGLVAAKGWCTAWNKKP